MRHRERSETFLKEPFAAGRRRRPGKRLLWRETLVSSRLYGRSRWLHARGREEAETDKTFSSGTE
jgi:hypothetical protein